MPWQVRAKICGIFLSCLLLVACPSKVPGKSLLTFTSAQDACVGGAQTSECESFCTSSAGVNDPICVTLAIAGLFSLSAMQAYDANTQGLCESDSCADSCLLQGGGCFTPSFDSEPILYCMAEDGFYSPSSKSCITNFECPSPEIAVTFPDGTLAGDPLLCLNPTYAGGPQCTGLNIGQQVVSCSGCKAGYTLNTASMCTQCPKSCSACDLNTKKCSACNSGYYLDVSGECLDIPPACLSVGERGCISCETGFVVNAEGGCDQIVPTCTAEETARSIVQSVFFGCQCELFYHNDGGELAVCSSSGKPSATSLGTSSSISIYDSCGEQCFGMGNPLVQQAIAQNNLSVSGAVHVFNPSSECTKSNNCVSTSCCPQTNGVDGTSEVCGINTCMCISFLDYPSVGIIPMMSADGQAYTTQGEDGGVCFSLCNNFALGEDVGEQC